MSKQKYLINNLTQEPIKVWELNLSLPIGVSDLFELNASLNYEQILRSVQTGTLRAAMDNNLCKSVPIYNYRTVASDVLIRDPLPVQIIQSRVRTTSINHVEPVIFDDLEDASLFEDDMLKPARELENEIKSSVENVEKIEATIKQADLKEKPIENRYIPSQPVILTKSEQQKVKNDIAMSYNTCNGINKINGKRCMRPALKNKKCCGWHKDQEDKG